MIILPFSQDSEARAQLAKLRSTIAWLHWAVRQNACRRFFKRSENSWKKMLVGRKKGSKVGGRGCMYTGMHAHIHTHYTYTFR